MGKYNPLTKRDSRSLETKKSTSALNSYGYVYILLVYELAGFCEAKLLSSFIFLTIFQISLNGIPFPSYEHYLRADRKAFLKTLRFYPSHSLFFMTSKFNLFEIKMIIPIHLKAPSLPQLLIKYSFGLVHWEGLLSCIVLPLPLITLLDWCHNGTGPLSNRNRVADSFSHEKICGLLENFLLELPAALFSDRGKPLPADAPQLFP